MKLICYFKSKESCIMIKLHATQLGNIFSMYPSAVHNFACVIFLNTYLKKINL